MPVSSDSVRAAATPWLKRLQELAQTPSRPAPAKPSPNLVQALMHLDLNGVLRIIPPLLDDPQGLGQALTPITFPPALKRSEQGHPHARVSDRLTPIGAALWPMDPPRNAWHKLSAAQRSQQRNEQTVLLGLLLAVNASVQPQDWMWSVRASNLPLVEPPPAAWLQMLLAHGAPVPIQTSPGHETLLEHVARFPTHWPDAAYQALIDAGIPLNHQVYHGPAVMRAVQQASATPMEGQRGLLPLLLDAGADLTVTSAFDGQAAIHQAVGLDDDARILRLLVAHGADPQHVWFDDSEDAVNDPSSRSASHGMTPLHVAAMSRRPGAPAIIDALLELGVPVNMPDAEHGNTPLHVALLHRQEDTAVHLVRQGASMDLVNHKGQRPADMLDEDPRPPSAALAIDDLLAEETEEEQFQQRTETLRQHLPLLEQQALMRAMDLPIDPACAKARPRL